MIAEGSGENVFVVGARPRSTVDPDHRIVATVTRVFLADGRTLVPEAEGMPVRKRIGVALRDGGRYVGHK